MSIHSGHRERLKKRFRKEGLENFDELYVLELLLFYCVPRQDTNELAHRLLNHFGSLVNVLEATDAELEKVEGVGEGIITFLSLRAQLERYYQIKRAQMEETQLLHVDAIGKYLMGFFRNQRNEVVYLLCLDAKCKVLACNMIGEGSVNSANVSTRKIIEKAIASNATSVVLAHNHPSGLALPSPDDVQTTHYVASALKGIDVNLVDHLVFTEDDYVSLVQSGYYRPEHT